MKRSALTFGALAFVAACSLINSPEEVKPGDRVVMLEAISTRDRRVFNVKVARGKLRKIDELDLAAPPR